MKRILRKRHLEKRESLLPEEVLKRSEKIKKALFRLSEYKQSKTILFYVSKGNEVRTIEMIKEALKEKTVVVPKADKKNKRLLISKIKSLDELDEGCFGILEPVTISKIEIKDIDLIIVPCVAFDKSCNRIGHGGGYYDRFLKKIKIPRIGLAFESQIADEIPCEPHDIKLDRIITEKRVI
jgi:5-formyltetrahydrofolate cyclo-ligase